MTLPVAAYGELSAAIDPSSNVLTRKLSHFAPQSESDREVLDALIVPRSVFVLKEGMAIRYRDLPDGGRQIITFLIPGDLCDVHVFLLKTMDHSLATITPVRIAPVSREDILDLFSHRPRISAALWWSSLQEEAMLRERIVSLGRRDARGRTAYILLWRHAAVGLTNGGTFQLPLTQTELGDTLGLTPVHVNRILKEFRERRLITIEHKMLTLMDIERLQEIAAFNEDYLHFGGVSKEVAQYFDRLENQQRSRDGGCASSPWEGLNPT